MKKGFILLSVISLVLSFFFSPSVSAISNNQFIIINKASNELAFFEDSKLQKVFSVGTGRENSMTPEGTFKIVNKIKNRPYYSGNIAGGDPQNPLGDRWLGINARGTWGTTYAIHGNNDASSIGGYVSAGCVRMHNSEVHWLYDRVKINTPVIITNSSQSFAAIAEMHGYTVTSSESSSSEVLRLGSRGQAVRDLQEKLTNQGYHLGSIDGIFGPATENAVRKFQRDRGLTIDGIVGQNTLQALEKTTATVSSTTLRRGSRGEAVRSLQSDLHSLGYETGGIDGIFGPATERAVKSFQRTNGITVDGIVGNQTLSKLKQ
ncbi:L,D-transpeptidase family protein [Evansella cellulosilytica]|uniref:ErfK/YbiS/YcfS/YnhG family protein n=1 Tax=Evansella cellulosilytica (strain ATCC 21833 / DSM 2522 / FERM P-1141 / JCM 9156 / N-4) TaxID=649639 RepID=E6TT03_EVAC2|nr:peptidoglycan-binding protein [Evansella cellulosilytica]ADU31911.1 ErfK/YbiS/YcfS/YnhG family protein [Evansella cellulosilytica DSM 2522]